MATYTTPSGAQVDGDGNLIGTPASSSSDPFIQTLQKSLLDSSGLVSSLDSKIETSIGEAIKGVNESNTASKGAITSAFDRNIGYTKEAGVQKLTSAQEGQRGFAVNTAAIKSITDYTTKSVNDLEQRKQELILQGDASAAAKISELQLKKLEFESDAAQQSFQNILSMGNFALATKSEERQSAAQDFAEDAAMSELALRYGIKIQAGDTYDSIAKRAAPLADTKAKLEIEKTQAQIAESRANTAKALADAKADAPLNSVGIEAIAKASLLNPAVLSTIKNSETLSLVINRAAVLQKEQYKTTASTDKKEGVSKDAAIRAVNNNQLLSVSAKADALAAIEEVYGKTAAPTKSTTILGTEFNPPGQAGFKVVKWNPEKKTFEYGIFPD